WSAVAPPASPPPAIGTQSSTSIRSIRRVLLANHRCRGNHAASASDGGVLDAIANRPPLALLETEPVEAVRAETQEVWLRGDRGESGVAEELGGDGATVGGQVELDRLRALGQVAHDEDGVVGVAP